MNTLINNPDVTCMLLSKLPTYLQDRWNRKVYKLKRSDERESELVDLIEMVDEETILVNDPLFSREAISQYVNKPDKFNQQDKRKNVKSYLTETKIATETEEVSKRKCPACDKNHDLDACQLYLAKPIEERSKFLFKNKLCYGCVNTIFKDHTGKTCKKRRSCKICNEKYLTTLHGLKVEKKSSGNGSNIRTNSQNSSTHNTVVVEDDQNEEICCSSTYTGSNVVSLCVAPASIKHRTSKVLETHVILDSFSQGTFMDEQLLVELQILG